ncbi:MAG: helix-turn-helix domain-containing protein [Alphaproteobacteria bacterium]|nr:helix-turn-helix domain-containing protein [Alphaproteobacteria bacterium]
MTEEFTIGQLARETGCKIPTIRYYEKIGLLLEPRRSLGNTRVYDSAHLARLAFICHCRELGFPQAAIRELLDLTDHPDTSCEAVTEIARAHLDEVNRRIARLTALKSEFEHMIAACSGGRVAQCRIIETLADHSRTHCLTKTHEGPVSR